MIRSSSRRFHGRIVVRNLPKGLNCDDELRGKPVNRQIDPSVLVPGTGPLHLRPAGPRIEPFFQLPITKTDPSKALSDEEWTTIQVFIYGNKDGPFEETTFFQMNRDSSEQVEKSLKRMKITFDKKLIEGSNTKKAKTLSDPSELENHSVWRLEPLKEWNEALSITNRELWGTAHQTPFIVRLNANGTMLDMLVEHNPPSIWGVRTFDDFNSHLYVGVPLVLDVDSLYCENVEASWFVNDKLVQQDQSLSYTPQSTDMGGSLSVLLRPMRESHDGIGCEDAYHFSNKIEVPPENYILSLRPTWTSKRDITSKQNIRIMTYNILADQNAFQAPGLPTRFYQSYVDASVLRRQRRMPLILQEILAYDADIVCLQEVDRSVYHGLFEPTMRHLGYDGYFSGKNSEGNQEGCCMFWLSQRFESVSENQRETHSLNELMPSPEKCSTENGGNEGWQSARTIANLLRDRPDLDSVLRQTLGHVVQMVPLQLRGSNERLWVSNTHLFYHPSASHIRTLQMYAICRQLGRHLLDRPGSVIVCGDFNANLTDPAGRILVERHVPANTKYLKLDLNRFAWNDRRPAQRFETDFPELCLPEDERLFPSMQSALQEAAPATHFIKGFQGTLDHIVVGGPTIEPVRSAPMPSMRDLGRHTAMPSEFLPSDHVSLVAELKLK
eukprot:scaffold4244_cov167-Amphora_coffeaeformis.AAC.33